MNKITHVAAIAILLAAGPAASLAQPAPPSARPEAGVSIQDKPIATHRTTRWTKARFDAARKRWSQNQDKFSVCARQLDQYKKGKRRMSYHQQARFLEACMSKSN